MAAISRKNLIDRACLLVAWVFVRNLGLLVNTLRDLAIGATVDVDLTASLFILIIRP